MWRTLKYVLKGLTHNADGTFSSTKVWQGAGYVTAMYVTVMLTTSGSMSAEYLLILLAATAGARTFQNYLSAKTGKSNEPQN